MSGLDQVKSAATSAILGGPTNAGLPSQGLNLDAIYDVSGNKSDNWYKSLPYGFSFSDRSSKSETDKNGKHLIWLPISPSNIQVTTHFATNLVTTLYGIVEEHSEVRYYDIVISGTTGYAPRYVAPVSGGETNNEGIATAGRSAFEADFNLSLGGFAQQTVGIINQVADKINDIGSDLTGSTPNPAGVSSSNSGYVAFHNLYRFFLQYKKDTAGTTPLGQSQRKTHPLQFLNYKDGIKYDVVPMDFQLSRSAESPMLYNYTIKLRAFNLRSVNDTQQDTDQLSKMGLGTVDSPINAPSIFAKLQAGVGGAMAAAGGIASGLSSLGL